MMPACEQANGSVFILHTNVDIHQGYKLPHQDTHDHCLFTIQTRSPHIAIIHQQVFTVRVQVCTPTPHPPTVMPDKKSLHWTLQYRGFLWDLRESRIKLRWAPSRQSTQFNLSISWSLHSRPSRWTCRNRWRTWVWCAMYSACCTVATSKGRSTCTTPEGIGPVDCICPRPEK